MYMTDRLTLDAPRFDSAGNMVASVLAARTGIQDYAGYEVGKPEMPRVRVFRSETEVFAADSLRSFAGAPVTLDHPPESVTTDNWKKYAVGDTDTEVVRDGEAVRVPFLLRDAAAISAVKSGKREISMGYACDLAFEAGEFNGQAYDAVQRNIRINHLAIVDQARGGPTLRIGDGERIVKKIMLDDLQVDLSDAAAVEAAISKLQGKVADATKALADATTAHDKALAAKDTEIDDLKTKVVDEAMIDARATEKADVLAKAKAILGDKAPDFTGKTVAEIRRMTVTAAKDAATVQDKSDDYVAARFDALKDGANDNRRTNALDAVITNQPSVFVDGAQMRDLARAAQY